LLLGIQPKRPDQIVINVRRIEIAAAIVERHDVFQCGETSVMKVRTAQADVTQAGSTKLTKVVGITGYLKAAGIFGLRANADVMKCAVAEKAAGMADIATASVKNALAALFGQRRVGRFAGPPDRMACDLR
jgi:hypothetical protein